MTTIQRDFIDFMLKTGALKFGDFTLKSGRKSPFFMNTGIFNDGDQLNKLGFIMHQLSSILTVQELMYCLAHPIKESHWPSLQQ